MITVLGSINVDLVTRVPRIPAPGETVLGGDYTIVPGGKGANQALAAARAGARVEMIGAVGRDAFADDALLLLKRDGVDCSKVAITEARTGLATIAVDSEGENAIVVASGANMDATADVVAGRPASPSSLLVLQMEIRPEETLRAARHVRDAGGRVILSLAPFAPVDRGFLDAVGMVVVNEGEAAALAHHFGADAAAGTDPAAALANDIKRTVIVTLGPRGAAAYQPEEAPIHVDALPVTAVDTTGAGDTFVGVLAARLAGSNDLDEALRWAAAGASLACTKDGAQTSFPTLREIETAL